MSTVLSTKILSPAQKQLILNAGIGFVEYNAIKVNLLKFDWDKKTANLIFTSKNAVQSVLKNITPQELSSFSIFCVGEKTAGFLKVQGLDVVETASYGADLAKKITSDYKELNFTYFCGNIRNDDLPDTLKNNKVKFEEIEVYTTSLRERSFSQEFDGILFFSPSGVVSFCSRNSLKESIAFCIGSTTASEAKKYSENIITATRPTIENVIVQAVKHLGKAAGTGNSR